MASGISASPQALARGNENFSKIVALWPFLANVIAHADPAGPPPTMPTRSCMIARIRSDRPGARSLTPAPGPSSSGWQ